MYQKSSNYFQLFQKAVHKLHVWFGGKKEQKRWPEDPHSSRNPKPCRKHFSKQPKQLHTSILCKCQKSMSATQSLSLKWVNYKFLFKHPSFFYFYSSSAHQHACTRFYSLCSVTQLSTSLVHHSLWGEQRCLPACKSFLKQQLTQIPQHNAETLYLLFIESQTCSGWKKP